jgi:putative spermidine/putrescine transport system substrate-binding protein
MHSNLSRRDFLTHIGAFSALAMLSAGCGRKGSSGSAKNVRFYGTATLDIGADGWKELQRQLGLTLSFQDNGNDAGPVIGQMVGGSAAQDYDLGGLLGGAEKVLANAGAILPWDLGKIPNWNSAWDWAKKIDHARVSGKQFGIPLVVNADSMIYRPDLLKKVEGYESGEVTSYSAVFDPRLKGHTSMEDAWVNSAIFTAIYLKSNKLQTIGDPGNLTESELKGVMEFLIDKKRSGQFKKLWNGWEQGVEVMRSGDVWVMTGWEPIVKALNDQGIQAKYAIPREGYEGWSIDLLLHAGASKRGLADSCHEVANWLHAGFYGTQLAVSRGYAVPNETTRRHVERSKPEEAKANQGALPLIKHVQEKITQTVFWQNVRPDNYKLYEEWWSKLRAA